MEFISQVAEFGYAIVEGVLAKEELSRLEEPLSATQRDARQVSGGVRNLLQRSVLVRELANSLCLMSLVKPLLEENCFPVRGTLFDKTPEANWKIPWHQDVTIAVKKRVDCSGYEPWSVKASVQHVQPPASILETMLSIRLHLDDCPSENGALRVMPGTHRNGKLSRVQTETLVNSQVPASCEVKQGGVLLMRPLLLHASSATTQSAFKHRRVIHIDYAATQLPCGLQWNEVD